MQTFDQCLSEGSKWHIVMTLKVNDSNTWKESVDFYFYMDEEARPRIQVVQFAEFERSHMRGSWKPSTSGLRKLTKEEKTKLLDRAMHVVGYYATVEVIPEPPREPLPSIDTPADEDRRPAPFVPDAFSTLKVFTCPFDDRYTRWITVPMYWKALLVIQVWSVDRITQMAVYGIGANWFKTLMKQGVPYGTPNAKQRAIIEGYFEYRARMVAGKLETSFADALEPGAEVIGGLDPKDRVQ